MEALGGFNKKAIPATGPCEVVHGKELAEHIALQGALKESMARHIFLQAGLWKPTEGLVKPTLVVSSS